MIRSGLEKSGSKPFSVDELVSGPPYTNAQEYRTSGGFRLDGSVSDADSGALVLGLPPRPLGDGERRFIEGVKTTPPKVRTQLFETARQKRLADN